ncbi:MAG: DNA polymerase III subunit alpha [Lachnospiraceae bacterium]|nr:DNA polymerase III subunit alpha [Lachnospiraceae bacterium]
MAFVHLHTHTEYSLLDGANKIKEYVARVKELGMSAAAITDHGVMYGVIDFYREALEAGIKPVIGCEIYVSPGSRFDRGSEKEDRYYHLVLLAENDKGYANLMKIVSIGHTEGYYYKPRVDMETLEKYHEGLIALSACLAGEIPRAIVQGRRADAEKAALKYKECFGKNNFFLELQSHGYADEDLVNQTLVGMSEKLDIPLVATNDIHYTRREDEKPHEVLLCLQTGKRLSDENRMRYPGGQFYVKSEEEMRALFPYAPEAIENTQKIALRCSVNIEFHNLKLPRYDVPEGYDSWSYLNYLAEKGLKERYPDDDGTLKKRMEYELSVIRDMGYVDYFLIVWDYINFAREHGIPVGPGRGSAAGAVVTYCLHITDIDPIKYDLLFERFLNPERVSMPDIDIDFGFERRQEVIDYVVEKYGRERCVQIITFGTLGARAVIRDVARVMDWPYSRADSIVRLIPNELGITLKGALEASKELKGLYEGDEEVKELIEMSMRLEGLPRHSSIHAAGILITPEEADLYVPLSRGAGGEITTQFGMTTLEELGLLKMDFLGLRTLTVIENAFEFAAARHPEAEVDLSKVDYDDPKVLAYISSGNTDGIFQLESPGMQRFMKDLKPSSLEDIIAGIALYRPGPMDFIPRYIAGKKDAANVKYDCPELEPILKATYGCIVYQEQVMQIVQSLGGYSLGGADILRRAMSKKKQHVMEEEQGNFVKGCSERGIREETARKIYSDMLDFAKYAFNKSHAACYAYVTMQTAWLKYYYPVEYMAALLTSVIDAPGKVSGYILSARAMGLKILPPNINESSGGFAPGEDKSILYGLNAIKSVGGPTIRRIEEERETGGKFKDLLDIIKRIDQKVMNKRTVEALIKAGAMDCLGGTRKQLLSVYEMLIDEVNGERKDNLEGQLSLFDEGSPLAGEAEEVTLPDVGEFPPEIRLAMEKEVLGVYVSGHPLEEYTALMEKYSTVRSTEFMINPETGRVSLREGREVAIGGLISGVTLKYTKKGDTMAILEIEDLYGTVECLVWPDRYSAYAGIITADAKVFARGRVKLDSERDGQIVIDSLKPFEDMPRRLFLQFEDRTAFERTEENLTGLLSSRGGRERDEVVIYLKKERQKKVLQYKVYTDKALLEVLIAAYGEENVKLV